MKVAWAYKRLKVYEESKSLVLDVYKLLKTFPKEENYALCDQMRRAAVSVPSNIAEGMCRISDKEKMRFVEFSFGSLMELDCQAKELSYISESEYIEIERKISALAKMLSGLRKTLLNNSQQ